MVLIDEMEGSAELTMSMAFASSGPSGSRPFSAQMFSNPETPIHRVPPEILAYILKFLPEDAAKLGNFPDCEFNWDIDPRDPDPDMWWNSARYTSLLQVCRYWRYTMLTFPSLWNTIIVDSSLPSPRLLVEFFVARSGLLPLRVFATNPDAFALMAVAEHTGRLQELRVLFTDTSVVAERMSVFNEPAPVLQTLEICYQHPTVHVDDMGPPHHRSVFLPHLFADTTPQLRYLHLQRIFSWGENVFPNLTHIAIQGCETDNVTPQQFFMLLNVLRNSPAVEEFNLIAPHPWVPDFDHLDAFTPADFDTPIVSLSCLRYLSLIYFAPNQSSFFLSFCDIPRGCHVSISEVAYPEGGIAASLPEDTSHIGTVQEVTAVSIMQHAIKTAHAIATGPSGSLRISADMDVDEPYQPSSGPEDEDALMEEVLYLGPQFHHYSIAPRRWHFNKSYITDLYIRGPSCDASVDTHDWVTILTCLPSLETLVIRKRHTHDILRGLSAIDDSGGLPAVSLHFRTLYICNPPTSTLSWPDMVESLRKRRDMGYPFQIFVCQGSRDRSVDWDDAPDPRDGLMYREECRCPSIVVPEEARAKRHDCWLEWPRE
ncbi:hypothetical protein BXZ70DRAFT_204052 [Cristinia sonorae]|uniref:F-box domain-containing protein n=1 Tax=Cristinia sonorae TaxID=1940300 RepID=A0A8K0UMI5_9AGAR|nr:hypothetical protein BXZ70DRAFT_204052 [Cristinia sonorae]